MTIQLASRPVSPNLFLLGGEPINFHSHHYNCVLEQSIEDAGSMVDAAGLLKDAGAIFPYAQLAPALGSHPAEEGLEFAAEHFQWSGFGRLDLSELTASGGVVRLSSSHYTAGFRGRAAYAQKKTPADHFACGYVEAAAAAAYGMPLGSYEAREVDSALLTGKLHSLLAVKRVAEPRPLAKSVGAGAVPDAVQERPSFRSNVDEGAVLAALATLKFEGDGDGLIPRFGVYLTHHYGNYYNYASYEFLRRVAAKSPELTPMAEDCLVFAGHSCAFNTFGGIMKSAEWGAVIGPMIREKRDWVFGITACINALEWGRWTVVDLD